MTNPKHVFDPGALTSPGVSRAVVREVIADGLVVVVRSDRPDALLCDLLQTDQRAPQMSAGDEVLAWHSGIEGERGVVLGRIVGDRRSPSEQPHAVPETLLLEAASELTLRVGDGSITIRADGKVLIKGKDLVSHAARVNRIKGGSVSIN
jgi:hypothetical protein